MTADTIEEPLDAGHDPANGYDPLKDESLPEPIHESVKLARRGKLTHKVEARALAGPEIVPRAQWGARAPSQAWSTNINPERGGIAVHYEGPHMGLAWEHDHCAAVVRGIQNYHMDHNGWIDIAYSYLVCHHGYIFEGRGLHHRTAANGTNDSNQRYYAICYIAGEGDPMTDAARQGINDGISLCQASGSAAGDIEPHQHFIATSCPGQAILDWLHIGRPSTTTNTPPPVQPPPIQPPPPPPPAHAPDGNPFTFLAVDGQFGPNTIKALQWKLNIDGAHGLVVDGLYGPATMRTLQARLNATNGPVAIDGIVGPRTIRALQIHVGAVADGIWGPNTTRKIQQSLNAGSF